MRHVIEPDPGLERLRDDHRSERMPAALRERLLRRLDTAKAGPCEAQTSPERGAARKLPRSLPAWGWGIASAALLGALWLRWAPSEPVAAGRFGPEPTSRSSAGGMSDVAGPARSAPGSSARVRPCPLEELQGGVLAPDTFTDPPRPSPDDQRLGATWHTLRLPTPSCGSLPRHFLQLIPPGTPPVYRGRVLILLPDQGPPESLALETRWYFDALARERQAITVYAKALKEPMASAPNIIVGGWQTDPQAHPQVDDEEYLDRIVLDLSRRGVIGGGNEVWLVGKGSGAVLALAAAAHHPDRYTGVAAFMPTRVDALPASGLSGPRMGRRLVRTLFVLEGKAQDVFGADLEARGKRWAIALGAPEQHGPGAPRVVLSPRGPGIQQIDIGSGTRAAPGVRILTLEPGVDVFPPPGGADALSLEASRQRAGNVNGAEEVWRYLGGD